MFLGPANSCYTHNADVIYSELMGGVGMAVDANNAIYHRLILCIVQCNDMTW